jgi:hypothetical protein
MNHIPFVSSIWSVISSWTSSNSSILASNLNDSNLSATNLSSNLSSLALNESSSQYYFNIHRILVDQCYSFGLTFWIFLEAVFGQLFHGNFSEAVELFISEVNINIFIVLKTFATLEADLFLRLNDEF